MRTIRRSERVKRAEGRWLGSEHVDRLRVAVRPGRAPATHRRERPRDRGARRDPGRADRAGRAARRPEVRRPQGAGRAAAPRPGGARGVALGRLRRAGRAVVPAGHLDQRGLLRHRHRAHSHGRGAQGPGDDLVLDRPGRHQARLTGDVRRPRLGHLPPRPAGLTGLRQGRQPDPQADEHPRRRHRLGRPLPPHRRHQPRLRDRPGRRHHAGGRRRRPPRQARHRRDLALLLRPPLRPAGALHLPGLHRRRPREAALLLHVPGPSLGPARADRR